MHPTRAAANKSNLVKGLEFVANILNGPPERAIVLLPTLPAFIDVIAVGDSEDSGCSPTGFHCTLGSNFLAHSITTSPTSVKLKAWDQFLSPDCGGIPTYVMPVLPAATGGSVLVLGLVEPPDLIKGPVEQCAPTSRLA